MNAQELIGILEAKKSKVTDDGTDHRSFGGFTQDKDFDAIKSFTRRIGKYTLEYSWLKAESSIERMETYPQSIAIHLYLASTHDLYIEVLGIENVAECLLLVRDMVQWIKQGKTSEAMMELLLQHEVQAYQYYTAGDGVVHTNKQYAYRLGEPIGSDGSRNRGGVQVKIRGQ